MIRALRSIVLAIVLAAGFLVASGPSSVAASASTSTLTVSPSAPMLAESFTLTFQISTQFPRAVSWQRLSGNRWVTVASGTTSSTGRATYTTSTTAASISYRVLAPKATYNKTSYAAHTSATRTVVTVAQTVTIALGENSEGALTVSSIATPARVGRVVSLQELSGGIWTSIASGNESTSGAVTFGVSRSGAVAEGRSYRAYAEPYQGASGAASPASIFHVVPVTVAMRAPDVIVTDDQGRLTLAADVSGTVSRVRFFVDARQVGADDTSAPWTVPWFPERGQHDVMARAIGPNGSILSSSRSFTVPSAAVDDVSGLPAGFQLDTLQEGFDLPTSFAVASSGQIFVSQKAGTVMTFGKDPDGGFTVPHTVVDISGMVHQEEDRGMIGIAVDPRPDADHQWIYVSYVFKDPNGSEEGSLDEVQQVQRFDVSHWSVGDDPLGYDADNVILGRTTGPACFDDANIRTPDCMPIHGFSHTIDDLLFDSHGNLLVGVGDGAMFPTDHGLNGRTQTLRAQDVNVLAGKILRIDPDTGRGVPGNPFYSGDGTSNASRVLGLGFRNPFRMTARDDDSIVVGEVGDDATEEIDVIDPAAGGGHNYGWPCFEGDSKTAVPVSTGPTPNPSSNPWDLCRVLWAAGDEAIVHPAYTYPHANGGSITGGVFYSGEAYPAEYHGAYFFGDYAQNFIRTARMAHDGTVSSVEPFAYRSVAGGPVKFAMGPDDTIWYLSIYSGSLRRIVYEPTPQPGSCDVNTFSTRYYDLRDSSLANDVSAYPVGWSWLRFSDATFPADAVAVNPACSSSIHLGATSTAVAAGVPADRFGVRWQGRLSLESGTYEFDIQGEDWIRVWVDDVLVHEWFAYGGWLPIKKRLVLPAGLHNVRVELVADDGPASADVTWTKVGSPPAAVVTAPLNGAVLPGELVSGVQSGTASYSVNTSTLVDSSNLKSVTILADLLHITDSDLHVHPYAEKQFTLTGHAQTVTGSFLLMDNHAPQHSVFRIRARVTDESGAVTLSAPTYVCLIGNAVGPCRTG